MLILLADDERLIRLGLQSMLEELYPEEHTYLQRPFQVLCKLKNLI